MLNDADARVTVRDFNSDRLEDLRIEFGEQTLTVNGMSALALDTEVAIDTIRTVSIFDLLG